MPRSKARQPKIEQTIVTAFGAQRVDRCESCHIAVDDPRFDRRKTAVAHASLFRSDGRRLQNGRWERRHKFTNFGCTVCHDGQGRGLENADAHGEEASWPDPMLGYTMQADWNKNRLASARQRVPPGQLRPVSYGQGFRGHAAGTHGRELFFKTGCFGCHRIEGLSSGTLGPDLTEVGKERKLDYLWGTSSTPRAYTPTSIMPQFKLSDDDRKALVIFLKSRRGADPAESPVESLHANAAVTSAVPESVTP